MKDHRLLKILQALRDNPTLFDHPIERFELLQTHISYVLLTGPFAYKFKKPVNLAFLDFSSLGKRKYFLEEELRLNRRLAPELYLGLVAIGGTVKEPHLYDYGEAIEYALKMREFPQQAQLDRLLAASKLIPQHIDDMAQQIAEFHLHLPSAATDSEYGTPAHIARPVLENFAQTEPHLDDPADKVTLKRLRVWCEAQTETLAQTFRDRKQQGWTRECHGDMHLSNMVLLNRRIVIFDCIEFSASFRWIDVISEIAFLLMDLEARNQPRFAYRFLNAYLAKTGDYKGLSVLNYYRVYRNMVRAKVALLQCHQATEPQEKHALTERFHQHLKLASDAIESPPRPMLIITHGLSGSGKSTLAAQLAEYIGAIQIRSDVERKRLAGLPADARSDSALASDLYRQDMTGVTYQTLYEIAESVLRAEFPVIVDATFLQRAYRDTFRQLARKSQVGFIILDCRVEQDVLRSRLLDRQVKGKDASEADLAVLAHQMKSQQPLHPSEQEDVVTLDTGTSVDLKAIAHRLTARAGVGSRLYTQALE